MARFSIPTKGRLSSDTRISPFYTAVQKTLSRLSRASLLNLVLDWLSDDNIHLCEPLLGKYADDDVFYQSASSPQELRAVYTDLQDRKGSKRDVLDRIMEGDWQHGLTLYQLAMADAQYLQDHPTSQKWTAYRILPLKEASYINGEEGPPDIDRESLKLPRIHPSTFIQKLQSQVLPDVKAYYHIHRPQGLPMFILRIFMVESPYGTSMAQLGNATASTDPDVDSSRTLFIAFPDASPYVYLSKSQAIGPSGTAESKSFRNLVVEGIPKALSRPRERYTLKPTNVSTKNIFALLHIRGVGRTSAAGGGWGIYTDKQKNESPLDALLPTPPLSEESSDDNIELGRVATTKRKAETFNNSEAFSKRARLYAQARFGDAARIDDGLGTERVDIVVEDSFPSTPVMEEQDSQNEQFFADGGKTRGQNDRRGSVDAALGDGLESDEIQGENTSSSWVPSVKLTFYGPHVFAGLRQLVENGIIDGERMPGWLTGEEGVTVGAVRHGRIRGHKGSGI